MARENYFMLMVTSIMVSGMKTQLMDMGFIFIEMEIDMRVNGIKIYKMVMALNIGSMDLFILEIFIMDKKMEKVIINGLLIKVNIKGIGINRQLVAKESTYGVMDENTKGNGLTTKCMGMVYILIQTEENMKVHMQMINVMVTVNFIGLMANSSMENGKRENSMVLEKLY